jgi:hypothetical protein
MPYAQDAGKQHLPISAQAAALQRLMAKHFDSGFVQTIVLKIFR